MAALSTKKGIKMATVEELGRDLAEANQELAQTLLLVKEMSLYVAHYRRVLEKFELDTLTGLPGSNKYLEFRSKYLDIRATEKRTASLGVIAFDVNDLKYYNDNKGHQAGDLLLQKAAHSFFAIIDFQTHVFRTGGDEFIGIITGCAESDIDGVVAKWQEKLAELNALDDGIRCTIAWGAAFGAGEYNYEEVLAQADERMYAEKRRMKAAGLKLGDIR